jgi:hypothetical protein
MGLAHFGHLMSSKAPYAEGWLLTGRGLHWHPAERVSPSEFNRVEVAGAEHREAASKKKARVLRANSSPRTVPAAMI